MDKFAKIGEKLCVIKVLILGSYHPDFLPILTTLQQSLNESGVMNAFLARDVISMMNLDEHGDIMAYVLTEVENQMNAADFNLFIFFPSRNDSTAVELTTFVKSVSYKQKMEKTLVFLPRSADLSMISGLISREKVNCFRYDTDFDIYSYAILFIKRNLYS